ncbi:uncharacterized protein LOC112574751 isoform X3 [Pomacea canaliculata]|uniref:uncharacterized protein LOC112574751 isoform X3 n=1 Tax=Pomacea canaliculata TaxID=400727 RepID=UPI000D72C04F|nr:uncharacterized protein LOC112574751 isoform X3 [Pomacea canaliculata]
MGVHLDETSSPVPQRWLTTNLDELVHELSNPLHHVTSSSQSRTRTNTTATTTTGSTSSATSFSSSCTTASGGRSPTYSLSSSSSSSYHSSRTHASGGDYRSSGGGRKTTASSSSGISRGRSEDDVAKDMIPKGHATGLPPVSSPSAINSSEERHRFFQSWREARARGERVSLTSALRNHRSLELEGEEDLSTDYSSRMSCESNLSQSSTVSSLLGSNELDEGCRDVNVRVRKSATAVAFSCDSTPDGSDNDASEEIAAVKGEGDRREKESRKGRFRKMFSRPLGRSQSAGCAKDVPAHALFLRHNPGDKGIDTLEERLGRSANLPDRDGDDDQHASHRPPPPSGRPIHKTTSADAAMMARDDFGGFKFAETKSKKSLAKTMKKKLLFLRRGHTDTTVGTLAKNEGKKLTQIHPEEALRWSRSFESLLTDKTGLELFRGFLRSEFSDENLEFWIACEEFKLAKPSKISAMAQKIYTDFVAPQAPREINVDSKTRVRTLSSLGNPRKDIFDDAQRRVQALMEKDSYPRFLESDVYQQIVRHQKS